jgi:hypothetical protein
MRHFIHTCHTSSTCSCQSYTCALKVLSTAGVCNRWCLLDNWIVFHVWPCWCLLENYLWKPLITIPVLLLWEPPTRQFCPKLPVSESPAVWPISVECGGAELHWVASGWPAECEGRTFRSAKPMIQQHISAERTSDHRPISRSCSSRLTTGTFASRHGHQDEPIHSPPGRDSLALHSIQSSDEPFEVNANIQCVCVIPQ